MMTKTTFNQSVLPYIVAFFIALILLPDKSKFLDPYFVIGYILFCIAFELIYRYLQQKYLGWVEHGL